MNFQSLWEILEEKNAKDPEKILKAIKNGKGIDEKFWDNFLLILNDAESLSNLLNVSIEKISNWSNYVKEGLEILEKQEKQNIPKERRTLLKTGLPELKDK